MNGIKTVRRTVGTAAALAALLLSVAGCIEEMRQGGDSVSFTASTGYLDGGVKGETKTSYAGFTAGSSSERIDWVTGDEIKIYCAQSLGQESDASKKSAVYTITPASSHSGTTDKAAAISPKSPDTDLRWNMSGGKHHYFAAYPSDVAFNTSYYAGKSDVIVFEHSVPAVQEVTRKTGQEFVPDMTLVAMGAYSGKEPGGLNPTVDLTFRPLVTALRVTLLAGDELSKGTNLTMLRLKSSYPPSLRPLAGSYTVAIGDYQNNRISVFTGSTDYSVDNRDNTGLMTAGVVSSEPSTSSETSVRIVPKTGTPFAGGVRLSETTATAFTFVMLPVKATDLTLELTFGGTYDATTQTVTGGTTRSLALTQGGTSWTLDARRKYYLNNLKVDKTWTGGTEPYNPSPGMGLVDSDFTYAVSPASATLWTGENFTLRALSGADPAPTYTFSVNNTVVGPSSGSLTLAGTTASTTITANTTTPGKAVVTVKATRGSVVKNDQTCAVTVRKLTGLTLNGKTNPDPLDFVVGDSPQLLIPEVTYHDGTNDGQIWPAGDETWEILDKTNDTPVSGVVTVTDGVVTPVGPGEVRVRCTITKGSVTLSRDCVVKVTAPFALDKSEATSWVGDDASWLSLSASGATDAELANVTWTVTSGADVVSLSSPNGKTINITPLKRGEATITATFGSETQRCKIYVNELTNVELSGSSQILDVGQALVAPANVYYYDAKMSSITGSAEIVSGGVPSGWKATWGVEDTTIAEVVNLNTIYGLRVGSTFIYCTVSRENNNAPKTGRQHLSVRANRVLTLSESGNITKWVGDDDDAGFTVSTIYGCDITSNVQEDNPAATWTSSADNVATVAAINGGRSVTVKPVGAGIATIEATWHDIKASFMVTVNELLEVSVTPTENTDTKVSGDTQIYRLDKVHYKMGDAAETVSTTLPEGWSGSWSTSDANIASIPAGSTGTNVTATAGNTPGTATLTYTVSKTGNTKPKSGTATLTVSPVTSGTEGYGKGNTTGF